MPDSSAGATLSCGESFAGFTILGRLTDSPSPFYHVRSNNGDELALQIVWPGSNAALQLQVKNVLLAAGQVKHPQLSPLIEVASCPGQLYCTTSLPSGGMLAGDSHMSRKPVEQAARLVEQTARAVHALHQRKILHRNLHPQSIGLMTDGSPVVMDFTLATANWTKADFLEQQGQIIGRLGYIAPEQAFARRAEFGPATDVYSLGAILYEMLTGALPWQGTSNLELLRKLDREDITPPSRLRTEIPQDLEAVCLRCLRPRAADRYQSANDMASDLRKFLGIEDSQAEQPSWWSRFRVFRVLPWLKFFARHKEIDC